MVALLQPHLANCSDLERAIEHTEGSPCVVSAAGAYPRGKAIIALFLRHLGAVHGRQIHTTVVAVVVAHLLDYSKSPKDPKQIMREFRWPQC